MTLPRFNQAEIQQGGLQEKLPDAPNPTLLSVQHYVLFTDASSISCTLHAASQQN